MLTDKEIAAFTHEQRAAWIDGMSADESFSLQPSSPYSASKAGSDLLVRSFVRTFRFPALITRSSTEAGYVEGAHLSYEVGQIPL